MGPGIQTIVPSHVLTCTLDVNLSMCGDSYMSQTFILQGKKKKKERVLAVEAVAESELFVIHVDC